MHYVLLSLWHFRLDHLDHACHVHILVSMYVFVINMNYSYVSILKFYRLVVANRIIIDGQLHAFQRFPSSKLVLTAVESRSATLNQFVISSMFDENPRFSRERVVSIYSICVCVCMYAIIINEA